MFQNFGIQQQKIHHLHSPETSLLFKPTSLGEKNPKKEGFLSPQLCADVTTPSKNLVIVSINSLVGSPAFPKSNTFLAWRGVSKSLSLVETVVPFTASEIHKSARRLAKFGGGVFFVPEIIHPIKNQETRQHDYIILVGQR